jgi:hypothetical protein
MRLLLLMLGISACVVGIAPRRQNYPWCAIYSGGAVSGGTNCAHPSTWVKRRYPLISLYGFRNS